MKRTFVVSDSSLNGYGFRVLTKGLSWSENIPMFFNHDNDKPAIGHWENLRVDGDKLLADAVFDEEDELGKAISRKVEKGHIKAASCGLRGLKWSDSPKDLVQGQTHMSMVEGSIREISICNLPANANALALYDDNNLKINLSDATELVKLSIGNITVKPIQKVSSMEELKNIALSLGLPETADEATILKAIKAMKSKNTELSLKVENHEEVTLALQKKERDTLLSEAITAKKITEGDKAKWVKLFDNNFEDAKDLLGTLTPVVRLSDIPKVEGTQTPATALKYQGQTWEELDKSGGLIGLKEGNLDMFKQMFKAKWGVDYKA